MTGIQAASATANHQVASQVALKTLNMANEQQQSVASLVEDAAETAAQITEAGKGEQLDLHA